MGVSEWRFIQPPKSWILDRLKRCGESRKNNNNKTEIRMNVNDDVIIYTVFFYFSLNVWCSKAIFFGFCSGLSIET